MPNAKDRSDKQGIHQAEDQPSDLHSQQETDVDFGPTMSLKQAQALRKGRFIEMEEFKARFGIE